MRTSRTTTSRRMRHELSSILVNMVMTIMTNPVLLSYCIFSLVSTTTNAQQEGGGLMLGTHYTDADLEKMTTIELERICLDRGFEVVQDDSSILSVQEGNGKEEGDIDVVSPPPLSHDDYVDAAKRCLAIEKEMNELLDQYPELAREFEEEFARMKQEQEELEQQIQHQSEQLGIELENIGGEDSISTEDVPSSSTPEKSSSSENEQETVTTGTSEKEPVDLSLQALTSDIIRGFIAQVKKDVKRILDLMVPVLQPVLRVGGVLWRQLRAIIASLLLNKKQKRNDDNNSSSSAQGKQEQQLDEQDHTDQQ